MSWHLLKYSSLGLGFGCVGRMTVQPPAPTTPESTMSKKYEAPQVVAIDQLEGNNLYRAFNDVMGWNTGKYQFDCLPLFDLSNRIKAVFPPFSLEIGKVGYGDTIKASHRTPTNSIITCEDTDLLTVMMRLCIKACLMGFVVSDEVNKDMMKFDLRQSKLKEMFRILKENGIEKAGEVIPVSMIDGYVDPALLQAEYEGESPILRSKITVGDRWSIGVQNYLYANIVKKIYHKQLVVDENQNVLIIEPNSQSVLSATPASYVRQAVGLAYKYGSALERLQDDEGYQLCTEIRGKSEIIKGATISEVMIKAACINANYGMHSFDLPINVLSTDHFEQLMFTDWQEYTDMQRMELRPIQKLKGIELDWAIAYLTCGYPALVGGMIMSHQIIDGRTHPKEVFVADQYIDALVNDMDVNLVRDKSNRKNPWRATAPVLTTLNLAFDSMLVTATGKTINDAILRVCIKATLLEKGLECHEMLIPVNVTEIAKAAAF